MVRDGIQRDLARDSAPYRSISCHTTPEILFDVIEDFRSALRRRKPIRVITSNEVFGVKTGDKITHPFLELLHEANKNGWDFKWKVSSPPVVPHMRLCKDRAVVERAHDFKGERYYDYYRHMPSEIEFYERIFENAWGDSREVKSDGDVKIIEKDPIHFALN